MFERPWLWDIRLVQKQWDVFGQLERVAQRAVAQETVLALNMTTEQQEKRIQRADGLRSFWSDWPHVKGGNSVCLGLTAFQDRAWKK